MWHYKKILHVSKEASMDEIKKYRVNASKGPSAGITILSCLFTIASFVITFVGLTELFMLFSLIIAAIFLLFRVIVGLMRLINYSRWLSLYKVERENALKDLKEKSPEDFRKANNLIEEGKTTQLLIDYQDIYLKLKPPHLWNCYLVTEYIVGIGIISFGAVIYAILKLYILI